MPAIFATAPAKTILFGEHAVVYKRPAIAVPIDSLHSEVSILANPIGKPDELFIDVPAMNLSQRIDSLSPDQPLAAAIYAVRDYLKLNHLPSCEVKITSSIPIASGLGSSASISIALIRAFSNFLGIELKIEVINQIAFQVEKIQHGNPSGIDNSVISYDRPIYFIRDKPIEIIRVGKPLILVIGNTGIIGLTKVAVAGVKERWTHNPEKYETYFNKIGEISNQGRSALESGQLEIIGRLMTQNQEILQDLEVSNGSLDKLVEAAMKSGAFGAKLCGSGLGGNMIALVEENKIQKVQQSLVYAGAVQTFVTKIKKTEE